MRKVKPSNTIRLAWWAGEEQGLVGSEDYVLGLSQAERDQIAAYLNFDMISSPNFIYGVYDADESSFAAPVPVPDGSVALEDLFEIFFTWQGIPYEDSEFSGRSDYQEFIDNGIPASGLFTGAEVPKTAEQEAIWEGVAGQSYDPCYHLACDSLDPDAEEPQRDPAVYSELRAENDLVGNVSKEALGVNSDAIAFAMLTLAYSTEDVNGVKGKQVPGSRVARTAHRARRSRGNRRLRRWTRSGVPGVLTGTHHPHHHAEGRPTRAAPRWRPGHRRRRAAERANSSVRLPKSRTGPHAPSMSRPPPRMTGLLAVTGLVLTTLVTCGSPAGAQSPGGPCRTGRVALTFDDGPADPPTGWCASCDGRTCRRPSSCSANGSPPRRSGHAGWSGPASSWPTTAGPTPTCGPRPRRRSRRRCGRPTARCDAPAPIPRR